MLRYGARQGAFSGLIQALRKVIEADPRNPQYLVFDSGGYRLRPSPDILWSPDEIPEIVGDFSFYSTAHVVSISGKTVELSPQLHNLLRVFIHNPERVLTNDFLRQEIWEGNAEDTTIRDRMNSLIRYIGKDYLSKVEGGYVFHASKSPETLPPPPGKPKKGDGGEGGGSEGGAASMQSGGSGGPSNSGGPSGGTQALDVLSPDE